jgi:hypothetical protein
VLQVAADYGGPRKEFSRLLLIEIQEKYFEHGLRILLSNDYEIIGKIFGELKSDLYDKFIWGGLHVNLETCEYGHVVCDLHLCILILSIKVMESLTLLVPYRCNWRGL